jgi:hypothetical protein
VVFVIGQLRLGVEQSADARLIVGTVLVIAGIAIVNTRRSLRRRLAQPIA